MKKLLVAFAVCLLFSSCSSDKSQDGTASCDSAAPACQKSGAATCPMMQKKEEVHKLNDPTDGDYDRMNEHFYNQKRCLFMEVPSENYDVIRWNKFM